MNQTRNYFYFAIILKNNTILLITMCIFAALSLIGAITSIIVFKKKMNNLENQKAKQEKSINNEKEQIDFEFEKEWNDIKDLLFNKK